MPESLMGQLTRVDTIMMGCNNETVMLFIAQFATFLPCDLEHEVDHQ